MSGKIDQFFRLYVTSWQELTLLLDLTVMDDAASFFNFILLKDKIL